MKTANIRELKHSTASVLGWVEQGESVQITRYKKVIGTLVPNPTPNGIDASPDFYARLEKLFLQKAKPMTGTEVVSYARGER